MYNCGIYLTCFIGFSRFVLFMLFIRKKHLADYFSNQNMLNFIYGRQLIFNNFSSLETERRKKEKRMPLWEWSGGLCQGFANKNTTRRCGDFCVANPKGLTLTALWVGLSNGIVNQEKLISGEFILLRPGREVTPNKSSQFWFAILAIWRFEFLAVWALFIE